MTTRLLSALLRRWTPMPAILALALGMIAAPARADFQVRSPIIDFQEWEFEHNGSVTFDKPKSGLNNDQSYTFALGYAPFTWWRIELEGETEAPPGGKLQ